MKISVKLFLTLLGVCSLIIVANFVLARWSFQQGFLEFISSQEHRRLTGLTENLVRMYQDSGNRWDSVKRMDFDAFVRDQSSARLAQRLNRMAQPGPPGAPIPRPPPMMPGLRANGENMPLTALYDSNGDHVAGTEGQSSNAGLKLPVKLNEQVIGELVSWPTSNSASPYAARFARQQLMASIGIGVVSLIAAALMAWFTTRRLVRPVHQVIAGVSTLNQGEYHLQFGEQRKDELGQLMDNLTQLSDTLEKNRTAKNRWFADISHELRTPLTVLAGEIEAIKAGIRPFDHKQLLSLEQEIDLLRHLVDDLYQLSLSDIGGLRYHFAEVDISDVMAGVIDVQRSRFEHKGLTLSADITPNLCIQADRQRLEQLFFNLFGNTFAYTDSPGKVQVTLTQQDKQVVLRIEDTAPGVPEEECAKLFDPLYRVDTARTRRGSGAGLGLSICRNIVEAHHGSITAQPAVMGGILITITLKGCLS